MGNVQQTSLVEKWDEDYKDEKITDVRTDILEFRSNKRLTLLSIGICRPVRGSADLIIRIVKLKGKGEKQIIEEAIPITAQYLQKTCMINFKKDVIIEAGHIYQIIVIYDGSGNYSYSSMKDIFKHEDHTLEFKKGTSEANDGNENGIRTNLITDLGFKITEGRRGGCF